MNEPQLKNHHAPTEDERRELIGHLVAYNVSRTGTSDYRPLLVTLRAEQGELLGGVAGDTYWGWLFISHLWVAERLRGQGWGHRLLTAAEDEGRARGCRHAHLDTFSFQALDFYQRQGYTVFGELDDFPVGSGHTRYYLRRTL